MPRPIRIQYENAYYHVMNRGRGRQTIFHGDGDYVGSDEIYGAVVLVATVHALCHCLDD